MTDKLANTHSKTKIVVAISGGVDSAVAAIILKEQGYDVHAVHMQNWDPEVNGEQVDDNKQNLKGCSNQQDLHDVKIISKTLNIPLTIYNFVPEYWINVFVPFLESIKNKEISNPDIFCNHKIKFGVLLEKLKKDFSYDIKIATGHYAKIIKENGRHYLGTCSNAKKDQTYFLSRLSEEQLKHIVFPLSQFTDKQDIRKIAKENGLEIWDKRDSRGICFIGKRNFQSFINNYLEFNHGKILDIENNKELGQHGGINTLALHQRNGLKISGQSEKYYVCKKDYDNNIIFVCKKSKIDKYLYTSFSWVKDLFWINESPQINDVMYIKTKHGTVWIKITIAEIKENKIKLIHKNSFITTPGQFIVFYNMHKTICKGSGIYI